MAAQRGISCHVFHSDIKVRIGDVYPDLIVICSAHNLAAYFQTQPTLIVEIVPPTTEPRIAWRSAWPISGLKAEGVSPGGA